MREQPAVVDSFAMANVVVSEPQHPKLPTVVRRARAGGAPVIVVTSDRDTLPDLERGVSVIEPDELLKRGVQGIEDAWDAGARSWLSRLFPGELAGLALPDLLWVNTFRQPSLVERIYDVAFADEFFRELRPRSIHFLGQPPLKCATLAAE